MRGAVDAQEKVARRIQAETGGENSSLKTNQPLPVAPLTGAAQARFYERISKFDEAVIGRL